MCIGAHWWFNTSIDQQHNGDMYYWWSN